MKNYQLQDDIAQKIGLRDNLKPKIQIVKQNKAVQLKKPSSFIQKNKNTYREYFSEDKHKVIKFWKKGLKFQNPDSSFEDVYEDENVDKYVNKMFSKSDEKIFAFKLKIMPETMRIAT